MQVKTFSSSSTSASASWTTEDVISDRTVGSIDPGETVPMWSTLTDVVKQMLLATFYPTYVAPTYSLTANQANGQEIGTEVNLDLTLNFNRWSINWLRVWGVRQPATFQDFRAWIANEYIVDWTNLWLTNVKNINPYTLLNTQTFTGTVSFDEWPQPKDSNYDNYQTPLPAWTSPVQSRTITALYPYFWGKVSWWARPTRDQALIDSWNKVVASSTGTITINFNSVATDWLWFAIPSTSTSKTKWYVNPLNNGNIWAPTDLFDALELEVIDSPTLLWNGVEYKIYVSTFTTAVTDPIELRNS